ncbi:MAG: MerR family transcriptional regulator [Methylobacteriaceae bacterium]|jgi:DNA-binding transcriptional MerR regulator|nr:MerR family transcriptional regulator [Methylobacteriaceae bacterium]
MPGFIEQAEGAVTDMPKDFMTSGEFAGLRNVNLNSLRYYEKLNLLKPAWIDSKTKYRYFRLEQIATLDTILFFIEVGLPLNTLKNYINKDGNLDQRRVLKDGKKAIEDKLASMKEKLAVTEFDLMNLEQNRWCNEQEGVFTREIGERFFVVAPFHGEWEEPARREREIMALFWKTKEMGLLPIFPAGMLVHPGRTPATYSFFVQVLQPEVCEQSVLRIPKGTFSCLQTELTPKMDFPKLIRENFPSVGDGPVILSNMLRDTQHFDSRYVEIQVAGD